MLVGIIGGTGAMGRTFAGIFERAGHRVICSGRNTALTNSDLAKKSDLVLVSVPIHSTVSVISEIAPLLRPDQVICDLTSVKEAPVAAMLASKAQVLGLHPMFGPGVSSFGGQTIIATPARCDEITADAILGIFTNEGARITIATAQEHDRMMAIVQGVTHFATLALADTMRRCGIDIDAILQFTSPVYRIELGLIGRILGQDGTLYADILRCNPSVPGVLKAFEASVASLMEGVSADDPERFMRFFRENADIFTDYVPRAMQDTDKMIEALVEQ